MFWFARKRRKTQLYLDNVNWTFKDVARPIIKQIDNLNEFRSYKMFLDK